MNYKQFFKNDLSLNWRLVTILAGVTLLSLLFGLATSVRINMFLNKKNIETQEASRPAELEATIIIDANCPDCSNLDQLLAAIEKQNARIAKKEELALTDKKAKKLIKQFKITKVPALLISGELDKSPSLKSLLSKLGKTENGTFVLSQPATPYTLIDSGEIKGRVEVVMLADKSCDECYQVTKHEKILNNFGINTKNKKMVDAQDPQGQTLIKKYNIKLLHTIILSGDIGTYPALEKIWPKVGTVETDGTYVFRQGVKQMGVYKDLTTNKVIRPGK